MPNAEYMREYRSRPGNAAKHRLMSQRWRESNREAHRVYSRNYYHEHAIELRPKLTLRTFERRHAPGKCTPGQLLARIAYYGFRCWICQKPYEAIDHVKPIAAGGTNWPGNLRPICTSCNLRKHARWPFDPSPMRQKTC